MNKEIKNGSELENPYVKNIPFFEKMATEQPKLRKTFYRQADTFRGLSEMWEIQQQRKLSEEEQTLAQRLISKLPKAVQDAISAFTR